ncbi:uncharacterized protein LOC129601931 [Paramacrobiotus metropolitanus]|uniref:uncharacterized protein LOC129601931 n=1 Tax=Paramacrobiotus metropolitanus TaxID=2943436 RepID=UPI002445672B|nr:uncharacterized protein LOC129601931 [Paramacrobiotus metropolitanus]
MDLFEPEQPSNIAALPEQGLAESPPGTPESGKTPRWGNLTYHLDTVRLGPDYCGRLQAAAREGEAVKILLLTGLSGSVGPEIGRSQIMNYQNAPARVSVQEICLHIFAVPDPVKEACKADEHPPGLTIKLEFDHIVPVDVQMTE